MPATYEATVGALVVRLKTTPQRLGAAVLVAAVLHLGFQWTAVWLWPAVYAAVQVAEAIWLRAFLRAPGDSPGRRSNFSVALVTLSSVVFGSVAMGLTVLYGHAGQVCAVLLLCGSMTNMLIQTRGSRTLFLAAACPYAIYLLALPFAAVLVGAAERHEMAVALGGLLLAGYTYSAWAAHDRTVRAEAQARAELVSRREDAEAAVAAKSAFVAMVSHELRTPLSGVLAAGEELKRHVRDGGAKPAAEVVVDAGRFMQALLDDLLDLAKLEAGRMTVEAVEYDIGHLVWSLERHWRGTAQAAGRPFQLASVSGLPLTVSGDPTRLKQILNNLLSNALKFTGPEGVSWTVDVCSAPRCAVLGNLALTVRVSDTGPGMTAEQLSRLFTAYDQTNETVARTHGGTGLGLAVSRELARRMGGDLTVDSAPGRGSTFILSLPLTAVSSTLVPGEGRAEPEAVMQEGLRVLVVDDHPLNRRTLAVLLEPTGAHVTAVESAVTALDRLGAERFDVVLTDLNMPEMDGVGLVRALRAAQGPNQETPVIAVTAADSAEELAACRAAGMAGHVAKPISAAALFAALASAIEGDAVEAEAAGAPKAA
jgi:signal transduction histidine kinase/CheY-like chemotaxis protein